MRIRFMSGYALLTLTCLSCSSTTQDPAFDHLEYAEISLAPENAQLEPRHVTLVEGIAIKAVVRAIDTEQREMKPLDLVPENLGVLGVDPGKEPGTHVFYGVAEGSTRIHVMVDGSQVGFVDASVVPQVTPPR